MQNRRSNLMLTNYFHSLWIFLFCSLTNAQGQIPKAPVNLQSPNAASLGQYGELPVSLFTGTPQIDIPLYSLTEKGAEAAISLSYYATGVKPDQHPGWVGLNWNLNAGGVITRVVNDLPDENIEPYAGERTGFFFQYQNLTVDDWSDKSYIRTIGSTLNYIYDTEPDEFVFNIPGKLSGKFYISYEDNGDGKKNRTWQVVCDRKVDVEVSSTTLLPPPFTPGGWSLWATYLPSFHGFILTDEDGTRYEFGGTTDAIEYSMGFFEQDTDTWIAGAWNLTKIADTNGHEITFDYQRIEREFINQMYISLQMRKKETSPPDINYFLFFLSGGLIGNNAFMTPGCQQFNSLIQPYGFFAGKLISPVYLKQISNMQATLQFNTSPSKELPYRQSIYDTYQEWKLGQSRPNGSQYLTSADYLCFLHNNPNPGNERYPDILDKLKWRKLDNIQIVEKSTSKVIKQIDFIYNNDASQRLMLKEMREKSIDPYVQLPGYKFFYDTSKPLPDYLVNQTDHWGFYNGRYAIIDDYDDYEDLKDADPAFLQAGVLNKIIYPTGGITEFTFEPHTYSMEVDLVRSNPLITHTTDQTAGGLRIKKITSYDPSDPDSKKEREYFYIKAYKPSSGLTGISSGTLGQKAQYYWDKFITSSSDGTQTYKETIFSTQSILPMSENSMGPHVVYSEVVEKYSDNSTIDYKFSGYDKHTDLNDPGHLDESFINTLQDTRSPFEPCNSKALERGKLLSKITYNGEGDPVTQSNYKYKALNQEFVRAVKASVIRTCEEGDQRIYEGTSYKIYTYPYKLEKESTLTYDQGSSNFLSQTLTHEYNNLLHRQINKTTTYDSYGREVITEFKYADDFSNNEYNSDLLKADHMHNQVLIETKKVGGATTKTENFYDAVDNNTVLDYTNIYPLGTGNPIKIDYSHTNEGNIESVQKDSDMTTTYLWGYNNEFLIAKVNNAARSQIYYNSFEQEVGATIISTNSKTGRNSYQSQTAFPVPFPTTPGTYLLSYWEKTGTGNWTYREQTISAATSIGGNAKLIDEVRVHPADALMTTYTYDPLYGMTSATDPSGKTTYYEYDGLGRLKLTRDHNKKIANNYFYHYQQ